MLKQMVSRRLRPASESIPLWQARYYDFNVWSEQKRVEKLRYIHRNPVKRGLAPASEGWRWSRYRFYRMDEPGTVLVNQGGEKISFRARVA
jgi:putative transposase